MRPCLLVSLVVVLAGGCRPAPSSGPEPQTEPAGDGARGSAGGEPTGEEEADEGPPRPEGAIYRSELVRGTRGGNGPYLMSQLGPEPYRPQGRFEGWVITRVWPGDPELCAPGCDLRAGDVILSVNGSSLETPEQLSSMLEKLDELEAIELTGLRDGSFFERTHPVLPDPVLPD